MQLETRQVVDSIQTRGNEIFNIKIYLPWCRVKERSLNISSLQSSSVTQRAILPEVGGKWVTEYLNTRILLQCSVMYSVKLFFQLFNIRIEVVKFNLQ